jgi:Rho guanine nucleotide exchange factor 7
MEAPSHYVQAIYSFKGTNNDEVQTLHILVFLFFKVKIYFQLCFKKGQILSITQREDGGWWEGTLDGKTGWFPSNYVTEYKLSASTGKINF